MSTTETTTTGRPLANESYAKAQELSEASNYLHLLYGSLDVVPLDDQTLESLADKFGEVKSSIDAFVSTVESVKAGRRRRAAEYLQAAANALNDPDSGGPPITDPHFKWAVNVAGMPVQSPEELPY